MSNKSKNIGKRLRAIQLAKRSKQLDSAAHCRSFKTDKQKSKSRQLIAPTVSEIAKIKKTAKLTMTQVINTLCNQLESYINQLKTMYV